MSNKSIKHEVYEETDKYRKEKGRQEAEAEKDSQYLDGEGLKDDLVRISDDKEDEFIVDSKHPENQEWHAREKQNEDNPNHP